MPTKSNERSKPAESTVQMSQNELMLRALKEKEQVLTEKMERIKTFPREEQAAHAARTQAALDNVREQMKNYAEPTS